MTNKTWIKTSKALEQIFANFNCSICKKRLYDPPKFLNCGHLSCKCCINNKNNISCTKCQLPQENDDILKGDTINQIIQACCTIAEEIDFRQSPQDHHENINVKLENVSQEKLESSPSLSVNKKSNINNDRDPKQGNRDRRFSTFRIPKDINKTNHYGETKLHQLIKKGNIDNIKALLDAGANPNIADYAKWTPLQECVDYDNYEVSKLLLERGADVNQPGFNGKTPLHEAANNNNIEMVNLLLNYKANIGFVDEYGKLPKDYCQSDEIRKLLDCNEDIKITYIKKEKE